MIPQLKSIFNQNQLTSLINLFTQNVNALLVGKENLSNKQNSLAPDGTNTKYPTVTAVNTGLATKQNLFDYSGSATGTSSVTINDKKGGVARFTRVIPPVDYRILTLNSNFILSTSKIIPVLVYSGAGFPVILSQSVIAGTVDFIVANLDVDGSGGASTDAPMSIEYQIVG
jgi:hypothetical protein